MGLIPPGVLRETLTVLQLTRTANGAGGWTEAWNAAGTVRGSITARMRARDEPLEAMQPTDQEHVDIVADARGIAIAGKDRLRTAAGRSYEIVSLTRQGSLVFGVGRGV